MHNVCVIGACGRVGLPYCLYLAHNGFKVLGYDICDVAVEEANDGCIPFTEASMYDGPSNAEIMRSHLLDASLAFTHLEETFEKSIWYTDVYVVMIGTPVDGENNPRIEGIVSIIRQLGEMIKKVQQDVQSPGPPLIVLRSTVSPGTTKMLVALLAQEFDLYTGVHYYMCFAPERISQGHSMQELFELPQLVGADDKPSEEKALEFFKNVAPIVYPMSTEAAELGKLMTNMYRYVNFALANEFMMLCEDRGVDFENLRYAVNAYYPRMHLEKAGPNVAGPCLYKDGQFLVSGVPYNDLIRTAFTINEGMPEYIYRLIDTEADIIGGTVGILGMTFKANNDDTRHSLSFKMRKILERHGYTVRCYDPNVPAFNDPTILEDCDAYVLMTPHRAFDEVFFDRYIETGKRRYGVFMVDLWRHFEKSKDRTNGIYYT
jgi:UDP-N-acetyl-D-mannosaminuronic acid dehydrogenase